jgi:hypothetical protein
MAGIVKLFVSRLTIHTLDQAKRIIRIVVGFTLLIIGIALIVLPGPATVVIPAGLAILAGEFVWARKLLKKFNSGITHGLSFFKRRKRK